MTDTRQRELERLAAAGDVQAEAQLLALRVRTGELNPHRVKLAAYCGHAAARLVLDRPERLDRGTYDTEQWKCVCLPPRDEECPGPGGETWVMGEFRGECASPRSCCAPCTCLGDAMDHDGEEGDAPTLEYFLRGLTSFGKPAMVKAAVVACWAAWKHELQDSGSMPSKAREVLEAIDRWLGQGQKDALLPLVKPTTGGTYVPKGTPNYITTLVTWICGLREDHMLQRSIQFSGQHVSVIDLRDEIRAEVGPWALEHAPDRLPSLWIRPAK